MKMKPCRIEFFLSPVIGCPTVPDRGEGPSHPCIRPSTDVLGKYLAEKSTTERLCVRLKDITINIEAKTEGGNADGLKRQRISAKLFGTET